MGFVTYKSQAERTHKYILHGAGFKVLDWQPGSTPAHFQTKSSKKGAARRVKKTVPHLVFAVRVSVLEYRFLRSLAYIPHCRGIKYGFPCVAQKSAV
jgi:hypothetical protein